MSGKINRTKLEAYKNSGTKPLTKQSASANAR
jgi:hypothetical protein